jgi:outer membrane protein TolC
MEVRAGVPADLLRRRPDVRAAEERLKAAVAGIGVAKASFYPQISLFGVVGELIYATPFQPFTTSWNYTNNSAAGVSFAGPIFESGRLKGQLHAAEAARDEALAAYRQTVLAALADAERSLVTYDRQVAARADLARTADRNAAELELSSQRYTVGRADRLEVLSAQLALLDAQDALTQADTAVSDDLVMVFKALGGGFDPTPPPKATQPPAHQPG